MESPSELHKKYKGKIEITSKVPIRNMQDLSIWYSPGVAEPCREIFKDKNKVYDYTNKGNTIAIISDGSRVLGLGNIGPEAGLPVMEGKGILFKHFGGVDAFPIMLKNQEEDKFIETVKNISPGFGGINLEDIESPKCFSILEKLRNELEIPVWHDDQQGTSAVVLAGLINSLKVVGKNKEDVQITVIGLGAANYCLVNLLIKYGFPAGNLILVDSKGILSKNREDITPENYKYQLLQKTNSKNRMGCIENAFEGSDIVIAASTPGPGIIKGEWIKKMNKYPIVFPLANPVPEILPEEAIKAGAKIVATGRSDYPNQVNNSLIFPGVFRGVLDVRANKITDEMLFVAAETLAGFRKDLSEINIIPKMTEYEIFPLIASKVGRKAIEQGVAKDKYSEEELYQIAKKKIDESRKRNEDLFR
ncbi:MAG: NADP-dependent malic enzyme [Candidatus Aenigmarchaeota archaeon]|nr:NADP-dependent malic enzyme [Candidatus Aenigmarchaeota archaeon]